MENFNELNGLWGQASREPFSFGVTKTVREPGQILFLSRPAEKSDYNKSFLKAVIKSYEEVKSLLNELKNAYNLEVENAEPVIEYLMMNSDTLEPLKELTIEARKAFEEKLILSYYQTIEGDSEYLNLYVIHDNNEDLNEFFKRIDNFNHKQTSRLFMDKSGLVIVEAEFEYE